LSEALSPLASLLQRDYLKWRDPLFTRGIRSVRRWWLRFCVALVVGGWYPPCQRGM